MLQPGVYPAAVTPFGEKGRVDYVGVAKLLAWFEAPPSKPVHPHGILGWLQPPDFPTDFYKHK